MKVRIIIAHAQDVKIFHEYRDFKVRCQGPEFEDCACAFQIVWYSVCRRRTNHQAGRRLFSLLSRASLPHCQQAPKCMHCCACAIIALVVIFAILHQYS